MKLHWKIALGAFLVSAGAMLVGAFYVLPALRADVAANIAGTLREHVILIESLLARRTGAELERQQLQPWLKQITKGANARITIIAPDGEVIADSEVSLQDLPQLENHGTRPEVVAASQEGEGIAERRSSTVNVALLYLARRVRLGDNWGVLRVAYPLSAVDEATARVQRVLWGAVSFAFILASVLSLFVSRWVAAPLQGVAQASREIAAGNLAIRAEAVSNDEVGDLARSFNEMAERLEHSIGVLHTEREQAQRILSTVEEGILLLDERDRVVSANRAFNEMFSIPTGTVSGRFPLELVRSEAIERALVALRQQRDHFEEEFVMEAPLHEQRFELVAAPILEGRVRTGAVLVFRDVTHTHRLEQVRKDFVANVSHELRTPLTSIRGYAETLAKKLEGQEPLGRFAGSILTSSERLTALVNDLLELSRLERPEFTLEKASLDLKVFLAGVVEKFRERAAAKSLKIAFEPGNFDHHCSGDQQRLDQVMTNLLDNAFKYTPAGGSVWVRTAQSNGRIRVEVIDNGPGVPEKDIPRLFERFYRVDKARSRELGGTGLGLSIVKHIIERHGGKTGVRNRENGGSVFWFELPA